jgi:hypothetical protein
MVQMKNIEKYLYYKSLMMLCLSMAAEEQALEHSIYQLLSYHAYKDLAQAQYWAMMHNEREILHTLMIL